MLASTMRNLFRWALTLETVVISFLSVLHSSNHGLTEILRKIECGSLPVSATSQLFYNSLVQNSLFRDWKCIVHHIAQSRLSRLKISPFTSRTCAHMKHTSRPFRVSCQHFCLHSCTSVWLYSEIFRDFITLIELILSVKIKYLPSASFSIWSIAKRITASSAVKTLVGPLIQNPILQSIE
jgi:hypothetical protein